MSQHRPVSYHRWHYNYSMSEYLVDFSFNSPPTPPLLSRTFLAILYILFSVRSFGSICVVLKREILIFFPWKENPSQWWYTLITGYILISENKLWKYAHLRIKEHNDKKKEKMCCLEFNKTWTVQSNMSSRSYLQWHTFCWLYTYHDMRVWKAETFLFIYF